MSARTRSSYHTQFEGWIEKPVTAVLIRARRKIYDLFMRHVGHVQKVMDIGVSCDEVNEAANFFEVWFPEKKAITAVGIEGAGHLEAKFPGLKYVQVEPNRKLPFADHTFDAAFSNAVIEHIVDPKDRKFFISEMHRVAKRIFIATPSRMFPIETHTGLPILHVFWPKLFYSLLDRGWLSKFYRTSNLRLVEPDELLNLMNEIGVRGSLQRVRMFGFTSNLIFVSDPAN